MNTAAKSGLLVIITAVVTLFATHGSAFFDAMSAGWLFLLKMTEGAPLGLTSFLLALALGVASQPFLHRWVPRLKCPLSREFIIESAALLIGVGVMWAQLRTLPALLLGLLAGLSAPYAYKGVAAVAGLVARALKTEKTP